VFDPEVSAWRPARAVASLASIFEERSSRVEAIRKENAAEAATDLTNSKETEEAQAPVTLEGPDVEVDESEPEHDEDVPDASDEPASSEETSDLDLPELTFSDLAFQPIEDTPSRPSSSEQPISQPDVSNDVPAVKDRRPAASVQSDDGNVIAFPRDLVSGGRTRGGAELAALAPFPPPEFDEPLARPALPLPTAERKPPPPVRLSVVFSALLIGGMALLLIRYNVRVMSEMTFAPADGVGRVVTPSPADEVEAPEQVKTDKTGTAAVVEELAGGPGSVEPKELSPYETIEDELRLRLHAGIVPVEGEDGLEGSLLIELSRLKVEVVSVDAPVLQWGGRNQDMPQVAEIVLLFRSQRGELDRELAAIGLVVGKYVQHYNLDIPSVRVVVDDGRGGGKERALDPERSRRFYLQRLSLYEYLLSSTSSE